MAKGKKQRHELLLPGAAGWERWVGPENGPLMREQTFDGEGGFTREGQRQVLALPASAVWVLPAWLKGDEAHLRDMAQLHLERGGVRSGGGVEEMQLVRVTSDDTAHLACIIALKEQPAPLGTTVKLPTDATLGAFCQPLPEDAITIWRELGRLVVAITSGPHLIYLSPLSAAQLDDLALGELNNICLQLGFQRVLGKVSEIVLRTDDEGDVAHIRSLTGLATRREERPVPQMPARGRCHLMPADVIQQRARQQAAGRTRTIALVAGGLVALALAAIGSLTFLASRERAALLDEVAELTPRASRVEDHRRSWEEISPAVDPKRFPMEVLLRSMEPKSAPEVAMLLFECAGDRVLLRGRASSSSVALQYAQEIKNAEPLAAYAWETPPPEMHSDDSATFELKGVRQ